MARYGPGATVILLAWICFWRPRSVPSIVAIANWEKSDEVPELSDRLIRHIYLETQDPNNVYAELVRHLNAMDQIEYDSLKFESESGVWKKAA